MFQRFQPTLFIFVASSSCSEVDYQGSRSIQKKRQETKNNFQKHVISDLFSPTGSHILKFSSPPNNHLGHRTQIVLPTGTKSLTQGPADNILNSIATFYPCSSSSSWLSYNAKHIQSILRVFKSQQFEHHSKSQIFMKLEANSQSWAPFCLPGPGQ